MAEPIDDQGLLTKPVNRALPQGLKPRCLAASDGAA